MFSLLKLHLFLKEQIKQNKQTNKQKILTEGTSNQDDGGWKLCSPPPMSHQNYSQACRKGREVKCAGPTPICGG